MTITLRLGLILSTALAASSVFADTTIQVTLWDRGASSLMMDDAHMAMMGKMDMAKMAMMPMAMMGITLDQPRVPAGKVTFEAVNDSQDIIHEMLVASVPEGATELPYIADENRVDEGEARYLGEISELDVSQSGALTIDMAPGIYIVFCNVPGHFISGMWTLLTVTP